jgi:proteasome lid subunit RPN8/RPN11
MVKPVIVVRSVMDGILSYSKGTYPDEAILLLSGRKSEGRIVVEELEIPPLAVHGSGFSSFNLNMLPIDFSVVGTVHSHPSGVLKPSVPDLNNFYGRIMMIAAYPYESEHDIAVFDSKGNNLQYVIKEDEQQV